MSNHPEISGVQPPQLTRSAEQPHGEHLVASIISEVRKLDPVLLTHSPETKRLINLGAGFGVEVTNNFGTPKLPKVASGTVESGVVMTYHNGGEDGHTSVGPEGAGVPRNVLLIADAVNKAAGKEVFDPEMRAVGFYAAQAHDSQQLCGRALREEGQQGEGYGDERLSAEAAKQRYLESVGHDKTDTTDHNASLIYGGIMATAFNPDTKAQNVQYPEEWSDDPNIPNNPDIERAILVQELVAAADLLGPTGARGTLGAIENCLEQLCLNDKNRILQQRLAGLGTSLSDGETVDMEQLLTLIGNDAVLKDEFRKGVAGQAAFFSQFLKYSDRAIRLATGGKGIDDLFPGRAENAARLSQFHEALTSGDQEPLDVWRKANEQVKPTTTS